jgi:cytoskeletal protein CcmA (bactofilin family)
LLLLGLVYAPAAAQAVDSPGELRASLEERFTLVPLTDGLLLQPLAAEAKPRAIEISRAGIALDGDLVGNDELRLRLGDEAADLVLAVAALNDSARRALPTAELPSAVEMEVEAAADVEAVVEEAEAAAAEAVAAADETTRAAVEAAKAAKDAARARRAKKSTYRRSGDAEVAVGSSVTVGSDEVTDDVLVMGGFLKVEGRVEGDATVIGGSATIEGEVTGDVTAIGGPVRLESGSRVHGDVTSVGSRVYQDEGARVDGDVEQVPLNADFSFGPWKNWLDWKKQGPDFDFHVNPWHWWTGMGWSLVKLIFLVAFSWLWLLLVPRPIDRMERRIEAEPWKTGLVGLLAQVLFIPLLVMLVIFLAISIIGIPLLLLLPFALVALFFVGWFGLVAVAGRVGSWARDRFGWRLDNPYWVVLVGLVLIGALSIVGDLLDFGIAPMRFIAGMFIFFGAIVSWAAVTIGFGAAVLTRFGTASSWSRAEDLVAPLPPLPDLGERTDRFADGGFDEPARTEPDPAPEDEG